MAIDLSDFGRSVFGGSLAGNILYGSGGTLNTGYAGISPGGGGQPPLPSAQTPAPQNTGGFWGGIRDFFNSLTDRPATNAGAAAGTAFYEKAKPWLVGAAVAGGTLLFLKISRKN